MNRERTSQGLKKEGRFTRFRLTGLSVPLLPEPLYRPDTAPFDFAMTQNNRGMVLNELASLPEENRAARLHEALAAYDAALEWYRPDTAPLDFVMTQNNRGKVLRDLARLPGEDRGVRLHEALAAYDAALRFYLPDTLPLAYASAQNNRGAVLSDLASLPGEECGARLHEALVAYDAALEWYRPDTTPLDFAMTQVNRALLFFQLADLLGDQPHDRRRDALHALWTAYTAFTTHGHAPYQQWVARLLRWRLLVDGRDFLRAWEELDLGILPDWLVPRADPPITNTPLLDAFLASATIEEMKTFWQQVPLNEETPFLDHVAHAIAQAAQAGNPTLAVQFSERLAALNRLRGAQG